MTQLPKKWQRCPTLHCLAFHLLLKKLNTFPMCYVMLASISQMPLAPEGTSNSTTCIAETAEPSLGLCLNWA